MTRPALRRGGGILGFREVVPREGGPVAFEHCVYGVRRAAEAVHILDLYLGRAGEPEAAGLAALIRDALEREVRLLTLFMEGPDEPPAAGRADG